MAEGPGEGVRGGWYICQNPDESGLRRRLSIQNQNPKSDDSFSRLPTQLLVVTNLGGQL